MANCPETSDYTSIQERLGITPQAQHQAEDSKSSPSNTAKSAPAQLLRFAGNEQKNNSPEHIPFHFADYLELVDWTGRQLRDDKRGAIDRALPPILTRLGICPERWLHNCKHMGKDFHRKRLTNHT